LRRKASPFKRQLAGGSRAIIDVDGFEFVAWKPSLARPFTCG
jgi:hypothetical protein